MKLSPIFAALFIACASGDRASEIVYAIVHRATADSIDFNGIPGLNADAVLANIASSYVPSEGASPAPPSMSNVTNIIDVHCKFRSIPSSAQH